MKELPSISKNGAIRIFDEAKADISTNLVYSIEHYIDFAEVVRKDELR